MKKITAALAIVLVLLQCFPATVLASNEDNLESPSDQEYFDEQLDSLMEQLETAFTAFNDLVYPETSSKKLPTDEMQQKLLEYAQSMTDITVKIIDSFRDYDLEAINMFFSDEEGYVPDENYETYSDLFDSSEEFYGNIVDEAIGIGTAIQQAILDGFANGGGLDQEERSAIALLVIPLMLVPSKLEDSPFFGGDSPEKVASSSFDIDIYDNDFSTEGRLQFCLYMTVQDLSRSLEWYVTQNNNPEVSFDAVEQELSDAHFYLDYYADCTASEAQEAVEEYTDTMIEAIQYAFPNIQMEQLVFFWRIPAIAEDNLYAARFFCENKNGVIVRGEGSGSIY